MLHIHLLLFFTVAIFYVVILSLMWNVELKVIPVRPTVCVLCVFIPILSFSLGSTDQFEEILSQNEELKVTQWVLFLISLTFSWLLQCDECTGDFPNNSVQYTVSCFSTNKSIRGENILVHNLLELFTVFTKVIVNFFVILNNSTLYCLFLFSELVEAARKALISRVVELTDDRSALKLEVSSLQETVSRLEGRMKEKEDETKRYGRLFFYFNIIC